MHPVRSVLTMKTRSLTRWMQWVSVAEPTVFLPHMSLPQPCGVKKVSEVPF